MTKVQKFFVFCFGYRGVSRVMQDSRLCCCWIPWRKVTYVSTVGAVVVVIMAQVEVCKVVVVVLLLLSWRKSRYASTVV